MATDYLPGWYTDPSDSTRVRYWNGTRWTKDTWNLAEVDPVVWRGPGPPLSIDFDNDSSSWGHAGFDEDASRRHIPGHGRRLLYGLIGMVVLTMAVAVAWIAWSQLPA